MDTLTDELVAAVLKSRQPESLGDRGAWGLWLSIVVAFGVRLFPLDPDARVRWAATCGWQIHPPPQAPAALSEVLLRLDFGGTEGRPDALGR